MRMFRKKYTDQQIVEMILVGQSSEDKAIEYLYRSNLRMVIKHILQNKGDEHIARDIFQDTIIIFCEQVKKQKFVLQANTKISTYLFLIAKRQWLNELKKNGRHTEYAEKTIDTAQTDTQYTSLLTDTPLFQMIEEEKQKIIKDVMHLIDEDCRKLLLYSIYEELTMKDICNRMGYKNEEVAKSKKYKCKEALKKKISESPKYADFLDSMRFSS